VLVYNNKTVTEPICSGLDVVHVVQNQYQDQSNTILFRDCCIACVAVTLVNCQMLHLVVLEFSLLLSDVVSEVGNIVAL